MIGSTIYLNNLGLAATLGLKVNFKSKVWLYSGQAAWHFITLPQEIAEEIDVHHAHEKRGWGSLPVEVRIGRSKWRTSIFPDSERKSYMLPIKAVVRKAEGIFEGSQVEVELEIKT